MNETRVYKNDNNQSNDADESLDSDELDNLIHCHDENDVYLSE